MAPAQIVVFTSYRELMEYIRKRLGYSLIGKKHPLRLSWQDQLNGLKNPEALITKNIIVTSHTLRDKS